MTSEPPINANAVMAIGLVRASQECITASTTLFPSFSTAFFEKSTNNIEFLTTIPAKAINPIMDVAVKSAPQIQCPGIIPMRVNGIGAMTMAGSIKFPNNATISI